jgi:hypothetical protein
MFGCLLLKLKLKLNFMAKFWRGATKEHFLTALKKLIRVNISWLKRQ